MELKFHSIYTKWESSSSPKHNNNILLILNEEGIYSRIRKRFEEQRQRRTHNMEQGGNFEIFEWVKVRTRARVTVEFWSPWPTGLSCRPPKPHEGLPLHQPLSPSFGCDVFSCVSSPTMPTALERPKPPIRLSPSPRSSRLFSSSSVIPR